MEDYGGHPLQYGGHHLQPLLHGGGHPPLAPFDHAAGGDMMDCFSTASELRQALHLALAELDSARAAHHAELQMMETEAARLAALVASAAAECDELRRHCHSLLLLLHHQSQTPPPQSLPAEHVPATHAAVLVGGAGATGAVDEHAPNAAATSEEAEMEMALTRKIPEKGHLVEAVVAAGPLLQTLLLAGPLPRWRHPPPLAPAGGADIPPFNPIRPSPTKADPEAGNNSFSSASAASSPESNCSGGCGHAPLVAQQALPYHAGADPRDGLRWAPVLPTDGQ